MRILHLLQSNKISGAENVVADICMMYDGEFEMIYCSPQGVIQQALADRNVSFFPLKKLSFKEVRMAIRSIKPDIVHAHDVTATVLAAAASGRIPVISHLHVNKDDMRVFGFKPLIYLLATKKAKRVVVVSESCLVDYVYNKQIGKKTICLKNVLYTPRLEKLMSKDTNDYSFDFIYIGRLCEQKNPRRVAKVASLVLNQCPNATFGIVGEGELKDEMEAIFHNEGVANRVVFTGRLAYPYKVLKQAKCLLMCSRFEGTPIVALEALALGVPIVSTPVDGMCELVENSVNGFLSDDDEEISRCVMTVIQNDRVYDKLSQSALIKFKAINDIVCYEKTLRDCYKNA